VSGAGVSEKISEVPRESGEGVAKKIVELLLGVGKRNTMAAGS
jgi:hypothetical protein